jgi:AcrR family transcriptional regulator
MTDGFESDLLPDEALDDPLLDERVNRLLELELGAEAAGAFARIRAAQEGWERQRRPDEGLRERKKRFTRQRISDVATTLFVTRGFDRVRVSEIADFVGVSEKTVYNYFPTKESMVFDFADEAIERLTVALRTRAPGESPARAVVRALREDLDRFTVVNDDVDPEQFLPRFAEMINRTPSLRAAWLDIQSRLVEVASEELAARADIDPQDPEPMIAARALVGLSDISNLSRVRHSSAGLRGVELRDAILTDIERAARLLETGLWSFNLLAQGGRTRAQIQEATKAAEEARVLVVQALRQAHAAWHQLRHTEHDEQRSAREELQELRRRGRGRRP